MRHLLISSLAGLMLMFAGPGELTSTAEANNWRREYRQAQRGYRRFNRRWDNDYDYGRRYYSWPRYRRYNNYYDNSYPNYYGYRNYGYRNYGYPNYWYLGDDDFGLYFGF